MHVAVIKQKRPHHRRVSNTKSVRSSHVLPKEDSALARLHRTAGNRAIGQYLQAKLADRMAEQVMQHPQQSLSGGGKEISVSAPVQRKVSGSSPGISQAPPSVHAALSSPGQPLPPALQENMGQRFGHDFSRVRVHTDSKAAESARAVNALAYTVGQDVVFAEGSYTPHLQQGSKLLAHELAHVIQQDRGGASQPALQGGALEQHADAAASTFVSGSGSITVSGASAVGLARQPIEKKRRLREMLNLDPSKPQDRQLGFELDLIENVLAISGTPLSDTAIVEKALELHKNTEGKVGGAVLAYYDRIAAGAVGGMLAQAAAPVVTKTDPTGKVEVLLRAGELALAHRNLQIDTALNLIEGFAKAGAVAIAGSLAGGLLMLAAAAAPAVFGAYASVSTMSAEAVTALALRLAPRLMLWAARNPYLAEAVAVTVVSTVLEVAETGTVDPMGVVFNLLHVRYTQLQTRTPPPGPPRSIPTPRQLPPVGTTDVSIPSPSRPVAGFARPLEPPPTAPTPDVLTPSRPVAGFGRDIEPAPAPIPAPPGGPVFTQMPRAQVVQGDLPVIGRVTPEMTGQRPGQPISAMASKPPGSEEPKIGGQTATTKPIPGSVRPSANTAVSSARGAHPRVIPRDELPARRAAQDIDQTQVDIEPLGQQDVRGSVTTSGGSPSQVPNTAKGEISKAEFTRPSAEKPAAPSPVRESTAPGKRPALAGKFDWEKLPRPKAYQGRGAQAFGIEAIEWGHGEQGANSLMNTIKNNPREAQEYLGRLRSRGITSDMARAWAEPYEQEAMRVRTNKTAKARAALMHLIAERL